MSSLVPRPDPPSGAASGREAADFEALFHAHYASLCEYIRHYVRSRDVAEELVQDLFVALWRRSAIGAKTLAVSYLYTAARNRAIGYLRHERVARRWADEVTMAADAEPPAETTTDEVHCNDLAAAAERAIAALPDRCRLIFTMSRQQGLSYAEIARALEISVSTVETQMSRALKQLRARLAPFLGIVFTASLIS